MYRQEIVRDYETRDWAMYLDGELVGFARTYPEAQAYLNNLVIQLMSGPTISKLDDPAPESEKPASKTFVLVRNGEYI